MLDLLRAAGAEGISRLELAEGTGLTPQAVSKITARLREDGLAVGAGLRPSTGGKPRTVLRLVPDAQFAVGLHLDRDGLTAVLVDLAGRPVAVTRAPLDLGAPADRVLADAADAVRDLCAAEPHKPVLGVGVAVPGPLDHRDGVLHRVTGFPQWDGYPLRAALAERTGLPVVLDKDTNAAALAVALSLDEPRGDFAYLHLGTGLGAGLVLGGEVHRGARTGAGEFGHQTLQLDGPLCGCGGRGCIEVLCLAAEARGDRGGRPGPGNGRGEPGRPARRRPRGPGRQDGGRRRGRVRTGRPGRDRGAGRAGRCGRGRDRHGRPGRRPAGRGGRGATGARAGVRAGGGAGGGATAQSRMRVGPFSA